MAWAKPAVGLVAAALLAACGGADSEGPRAAGGTEPGAAEGEKPRAADGRFVRRVDALCESANPELARINTAILRTRDDARAGRAGLPQTFRTFATLLRRASAVSSRLESRLAQVPAPPAERAFHKALLESVGRGVANVRRQVAAAESRDAIALRELSMEGSVLSARTKGLVRGHGGFRFCGQA